MEAERERNQDGNDIGQSQSSVNIANDSSTNPAISLQCLEAKSLDENEMKDIQLYEEEQPSETGGPEINTDSRGRHNTTEIRQESNRIEATEAKHNDAEAVDPHLDGQKFVSLSSIANSQLGKTVIIHSKDETSAQTIDRLKQACADGTLGYKDVIDGLFNTLVDGPFDVESRFVINDPEDLDRMLDLVDICPVNVQAEMWSVFIAIVRKSFINLEKTSRAGLISKLLDRLVEADSVTSELLVQLLIVLSCYSIPIKEFKHFLRSLRAEGTWKTNSIKLLKVMEEMPKRDGPDVFFSFPGKSSAGISLPPISRWPHQNGWTFSTWFRMDPINSVCYEREKPFLFSFSTSKGLGYFCNFVGNCLVLKFVRAPAKEVMKCIKFEFNPRKWYHIAFSFIFARWGRNEVHCFVDGCLVDVLDANWLVSSTEHFDRCFVGCGSGSNPDEAFSGQLAALYVFSQSISANAVVSLFCIGPSYQSQFKHEAETNLPENHKKVLFDGKLNESLVFAYCPKNCHGQLCLYQHSSLSKYFLQVPHAVMKNGVEVITTHSIHNALHSLGGIQVLLPLFTQIDLVQHSADDQEHICNKLLLVISALLNSSVATQLQFLHCKGFSVIASILANSSPRHFNINFLENLISISKSLQNFSSGFALLKQLLETMFLASSLWVQAHPTVQIRFYNFLANEFFAIPGLLSVVRRTQTVAILMNTLKRHYWVAGPSDIDSAAPRNDQLERSVIVQIRSCILQIVNSVMFTLPAECDEKEVNRDDEFQSIFSYISTVREDDNLYDVLTLTMRLICDHPAIMVPAFDRKKAIFVLYMLISSSNELIRIPALKMFGYYLCRSTQKRKNESINQRNILHLIADKLLLNNRSLTLATYNALYEILIEQICPEILFVKHEESPVDATRFENPQMLKVIAQLLTQSEESAELIRLKRLFLQDMIRLCKDSRENRRTILQISVWQDCFISLAYIHPKNEEENVVSELVYQLFAILLFHAIRLEYGGWRVWVDTMAIAHSKVSWQSHRTKVANRVGVEGATGGNEEIGGEAITLYRTPDFVWSKAHIRLLTDLLELIVSVVHEWNNMSAPLAEQINNSDNQVFVSNTVHIISQLSDSIVMACGGLLPLLAAATAPNSEIEIADSTQQQLDLSDAVKFLDFFAELTDTFIFSSSINLNELEQEKNMPAGGILRQSLRLSSTAAVRNVLSYSLSQNEGIFRSDFPRFAAIRKFVENYQIEDEERGKLLQLFDLQRLKGVIYRDMEETKQAQFLALASVYFLSVLMVSRYRDILEPPSSGAGRSGSTTNGSLHERRRTSLSDQGKSGQTPKPNESVSATEEHEDEEHLYTQLNTDNEKHFEEDEEQKEKDMDGRIASIRLNGDRGNESSDATATHHYGLDHLTEFNQADVHGHSAEETDERRFHLVDNLQQSIEPVLPLFREILSDFRPFLQKTLLGTHTQEIMNDVKVMQTLKGGSVIEVVMLLCSQEWQTSLQKHAGLAFIELVNEGRLMAHATKDHILRVANEADFILNRLRAEDVSKHAQFEIDSNENLTNLKKKEQLSEQLIASTLRREHNLAEKLLDKIKNILTSPTGAWYRQGTRVKLFMKLDLWEDDSRRRRRFVENPHGQKYTIASKATRVDKREGIDEILRDLAHKMVKTTGHSKAVVQDLIDEAEIERWLKEENDLADSKEDQRTFSIAAKLIAPGLIVPGTLSLTTTDLYFDADQDHPLFKKQSSKCLQYCEILNARWSFQEIRAIFLRRYLMQYTALELFLASRTAIMFAFADADTVRRVVSFLPSCGIGVKYGLPQSRKASLMTPRQLFKHSDMPQKWQQREISNFDYLMFLNTIAGRTYNDLNQYPVFPWVLSNYTSEKLDLSDISNFRDLSKPIGALSEPRRKFFQDRFNNWEDHEVPAFHFGTHFSTQAFTLNWLFRVEPFSTLFMDLQSGRYDHSDRLFHSLAQTWEHCLTDSHDVKELVPEMFYLPEMFCNLNDYEFGVREDGAAVGDVVLPPWANGSAEQFVKIHRQALESDLVSCQLNQWIDLVFGYKQRGPEAVRTTNVFYHLTYEGAVNLQSIENGALRESVQEQILNFGQTPAQLLAEPHSPRHSVMTISPLMFKPAADDLCMLMKFISNSPIVHITANTHPQLPEQFIVTIAQNLVFALNRWNPNYNVPQKQSPDMFGVTLEKEKQHSSSQDSSAIATSDLPVTVDPLLAVGNPSQKLPRRHLGDPFDQRLRVSSHNFVCTVDSKSIIACGYPDYSFRVIEADNAQVRQVVYGHANVVTCLARSETSFFADCYIASGSSDCTIVLWHFSQQLGVIAGEYSAPGETPSPRAILMGHETDVTAICVSAEHGIVISGSNDGTVLIHTTMGDLLRNISCNDPTTVTGQAVANILLNRDCQIAVFYGHDLLVTFTTTGRQLHPVHKSREKILCATLSRDGEYIALGTECGRIAVFRLFPLQTLYTFAQTDSPIRSVAMPSNQRLIFGGLDSGAIVVFNVDFNRWHFDYSRIRQSQR